jgi:hypothetical protein
MTRIIASTGHWETSFLESRAVSDEQLSQEILKTVARVLKNPAA